MLTAGENVIVDHRPILLLELLAKSEFVPQLCLPDCLAVKRK